jgi:hypothetical protein
MIMYSTDSGVSEDPGARLEGNIHKAREGNVKTMRTDGRKSREN